MEVRRDGGSIVYRRTFEEKFAVLHAVLRQTEAFQITVIEGFDFTKIVQIKCKAVGGELYLTDYISRPAGVFDIGTGTAIDIT